MSDAGDLLRRLGTTFTLHRVFRDAPSGRAEAAEHVAALLARLPALARETDYLSLLALTGGFEAHDDEERSFCLFGFGEPGYDFASLYEVDPLDGNPFFRFGDLMLPSFEDNLVFAFDLAGEDRAVYATPGNLQTYSPHAPGFLALLDRIRAGE